MVIGGRTGLLILMANKTGDTQADFDGGKVAQIPTFQFVTGNSNQGIRFIGIGAILNQARFDQTAIFRVFITQDYKPGIRHTITTHPLGHLLFEILLAFEDDEATVRIFGQDFR